MKIQSRKSQGRNTQIITVLPCTVYYYAVHCNYSEPCKIAFRYHTHEKMIQWIIFEFMPAFIQNGIIYGEVTTRVNYSV